MTALGVILARAGSVGLAGKHLRALCGRPVISYAFEHARSAQRLTRIAVSTDCPTIKGLALAQRFDVIDRPANLATSEASVQDAMLHAMKTMEERYPEFHADAVVVLYGNVPVRPAGIIDRALKHLADTRCDSVRSFTPVGKWHPAWMSRLHRDRVEAVMPGSIHRRQDLEPLFLHDGAVVAVSRTSMLRGLERPNDPHAFFGTDRRGITVEPGQTVEIDQLRDLYWAEAVLRDQEQLMAKAG